MTRLGGTIPVPVAAGRKVKRCCEVERGPTRARLDRTFLFAQARAAARSLVGFDDEGLHSLWEQLFELPEYSLSLLVSLPKTITPDDQRLMQAVSDEDPEEFMEALPTVLERVDTPENRAALARSVLVLERTEELEEALAAAAIIDLADQSRSTLVCASLIRSSARSRRGIDSLRLLVRRSLSHIA
jgi:hypothetical protein